MSYLSDEDQAMLIPKTQAQIVAKELRDKYEWVLYHHYGDGPQGSANNKCALACVDHILENQNTREIDYIFYTEVREELKKLW
jgi:hypothetical protein|tara:strand:+ start:111 stop:359 length:249 start_codon:yes stop_codon:yes gene_type:complete